MFLDFFRRRKSNIEDEVDRNLGYAPLMEDTSGTQSRGTRTSRRIQKANGTGKRQVVEYCEEIIDTTRELEHIRKEYQDVTDDLNDILLVEGLSEKQLEPIQETAKQMLRLEEQRNAFLTKEKRMEDTRFAQFQEDEDSIPTSVKRLKSNEVYLDAIKRDMHFLEGEKMEWAILRQECEHEQRVLRFFAVLLLGVFSLAILLLLVLKLYMEYDIALAMLFATFLATLIGSVILFKYQDCTREIKRSDINRNQAISLENHVKLKYVNIKNAVDYTCEKYHVKNSYELTYLYEQYQAAAKEQESFRQTNDDLAYYSQKLVGQLEAHHLKDPYIWMHSAGALVDKKAMIEFKQELVARRQKLREQIEENMNLINHLKKEVEYHISGLGEVSRQVQQILQRIDEINNFS